MTYNEKSLDNYKRFERPLCIQLANNSCLYSYGKGNVYLTLAIGNEQVSIVLNDVLFVPKLQNKLFSLPIATSRGATMEFTGKSCGIKINGKCYEMGHKHGKLYKLNTVNDSDETCCMGTSKKGSLDLWHQRYGHLGYEALKKLVKNESVNGLGLDVTENLETQCEGCEFEKQHRNSFPKLSESEQPLKLIHSDVCGPEHQFSGRVKVLRHLHR